MKLEKGEKVFYMKVVDGKIEQNGTRNIQDVEQVGGYIYVTLDDGNYFQLRPIDKDQPLISNSVTEGVYEFMCEDNRDGRKYIKHHLKSLAEIAVTQMAKYRTMKENLVSVLEDKIWLM